MLAYWWTKALVQWISCFMLKICPRVLCFTVHFLSLSVSSPRVCKSVSPRGFVCFHPASPQVFCVCSSVLVCYWLVSHDFMVYPLLSSLFVTLVLKNCSCAAFKIQHFESTGRVNPFSDELHLKWRANPKQLKLNQCTPNQWQIHFTTSRSIRVLSGERARYYPQHHSCTVRCVPSFSFLGSIKQSKYLFLTTDHDADHCMIVIGA